LDQIITTQNQHSWLAKLLGYEFDIVYKQGVANRVADTLSRRDEEVLAISSVYWPDYAE